MAGSISKIGFTIGLDENRVPEKIIWDSEEGNIHNDNAKALLVSVWDSEKKETLRMDLWTKEMPVTEMKLFFYQTLASMAATFERATGEKELTVDFNKFCNEFAEKLGLEKK